MITRVDLEKISKQFVNKNLLLCRSKSGGGHIFIFTKKFVPASKMIKKMKRYSQSIWIY
jgi:hypothetical protein